MAKNKKKEDDKIHYAQAHGIPRVTLSDARDQIELALKFNQTRGCTVLVGDAGCGKTQIFGQIAEDNGYKLTVINTASFNLMSGGIPSTKDMDGIYNDFFKIKVPMLFPKKGEKVILFFDELNKGMVTAINTFFNLLEDRRIYDYTLPPNCLIAGAMNPSTKDYDVTMIENNAAFRRRIKFLYIIPSYSAFVKHAKTKKFHKNSTVEAAKNKPCHPDVLSFIASKAKTVLYDNKAKEKGQQYACPATWETVSEACYLIQKETPFTLCDTFTLIQVGSTIGEPMAAAFAEFIANNSKELNASNILKQYSETEKPIVLEFKNKKNGKLGEACLNVSELLFATKPDLDKVLPNLVDFWSDLPDDIVQSAIRVLHTIAKDNQAEEYFEQLMLGLNTDEQISDKWQKLHLRLDSGIRISEKEVDNTTEAETV